MIIYLIARFACNKIKSLGLTESKYRQWHVLQSANETSQAIELVTA